MFSQSRSQRGFTLIELLVVIAIIGILSSVVLASLNSARKKGRDARRVADVKQMQLALELYYDNNSSEYPDDIYAAAPAGLSPTYISVVPKDPQTNTNYPYKALLANGTTACPAATQCPSYVLAAHIEGIVPAGDIDGVISTVTCTDSGEGQATNEFCVQP
jgi:prepilin-type N-terminal cleavage/methylation domain-containing protein